MIFSEYNKHINRPVKIFGINFMDFMYVVISLVLYMFISGALKVPLIINLIVAFTHVCTLFYLRFANKQDHPTYLFSLISFIAFQPKYISFKRPRPKYGKPKK